MVVPHQNISFHNLDSYIQICEREHVTILIESYKVHLQYIFHIFLYSLFCITYHILDICILLLLILCLIQLHYYFYKSFLFCLLFCNHFAYLQKTARAAPLCAAGFQIHSITKGESFLCPIVFWSPAPMALSAVTLPKSW